MYSCNNGCACSWLQQKTCVFYSSGLAQSYCRETFTDLATVNNLDENDRLLSASQTHGNFAWIGLYDDLTRWKWSLANADFNIDTDFSNWPPTEPNNKKSKQVHCNE